MDPYIPFCGLPPDPGTLWSRWTLDPLLLTLLAALGATLALRAQDRTAGAAGWTLVALLFVSPLCALSMSLFSARVAQHLLVTLIAAPLLARALPLRLPALPAAALFGALFWAWHLPGPYAATLTSDAGYLAMHLSLLGAAWALWSGVRAALHPRPAAALGALALTAALMTALAAALVLSAGPWHAWHVAAAPEWGLSGHADQQLAGALMWVAGGALMLAAAAGLTFRLVTRGTAA